MLNWTHNGSIDTYEAVIETQTAGIPDIKLVLSHTPKRDFWLLSVNIDNTHSATTVNMTNAGIDINDINAVKTCVEKHALTTIRNTITAMNQLSASLLADMESPMPSHQDMARRLYAEYVQIPEQDGNPGHIGIKWRNFSADCSRRYIEKWFQKNFGISTDELKAGTTS